MSAVPFSFRYHGGALVALPLFIGCAAPAVSPRALQASTQVGVPPTFVPETPDEAWVASIQNAVPTTDVPLDPLEALIQEGLQRNEALRAAHAEWQAALERVDVARALPDPRLGWIEFVEELQTRTGPHARRVQLSQRLPWFGVRRFAGDAARGRAAAAWARAEGEALRVRARIESAWFELGYLARGADVTRRALRLLQDLEPVVRRRIETGRPQNELLRLELEVAVTEERLAALAAREEPLRAELAAAAGRDALDSEMAPVLEPPALGKGLDATLDPSLDRALDEAHTNPHLQALESMESAARAELDAAGRRRFPDVTVGVDWLQVDEAIAPGTPGSGDDPFALRLSLNLPLGTGGHAAAQRAARHNLRAASLRRAEAQRDLAVDVRRERRRLEDALRRVQLNEHTLLPRALETMELTLSTYRAGTATVLELIDAERLALGFELDYWRACRDVALAHSALQALLGGPEQ